MNAMRERGIELMYGRWLIEGAPRVLLINTGTGYKWLDEWKGDLWNAAGIPSPASDSETNEAIVFGYLVAWFLGEVSCSACENFSHQVVLTLCSICHEKPVLLSLLIFTNGSLVLHCR